MFLKFHKANIDRKMNKRERDRLEFLKRRIKFLEERDNNSIHGLDSLDRREISALQWAVSYIEESNKIKLERIDEKSFPPNSRFVLGDDPTELLEIHESK